MTDDTSKSLDILGIKPIADSLNSITKETLAAASAFLSRICLPAAEEFGFLLRDRVSSWRINNQLRMLQKSEEKYKRISQESLHAHPRLVASILDHSAWTDAADLHDMWAGLLASSCTPDGKDESNLIFVNILAQLTAVQGNIIKHCCETAQKGVSKGGWIHAEEYFLELPELEEIVGINDFHRLDRELDHLRALGIMEGGFMPDSKLARLTPSPLGLQMYVRCQGYTGSPLNFFGIEDHNK